MTGEIVHFRKRFIGGFNRDDVTAYITKITKERNDSITAKEKAEREVLVLRGENNPHINEYKEAKEKAEEEVERLLIQQHEMRMKQEELQAKIEDMQAMLDKPRETQPEPDTKAQEKIDELQAKLDSYEKTIDELKNRPATHRIVIRKTKG